MRREVCREVMLLDGAQRVIATDWLAMYTSTGSPRTSSSLVRGPSRPRCFVAQWWGPPAVDELGWTDGLRAGSGQLERQAWLHAGGPLGPAGAWLLEHGIRAACADEAAALARLHVEAWQWAYRGRLPDSFLDGLSTIPRQEELRTHRLAETSSENRTWVAEQNGRIVGFCDTRAPDEYGQAELQAIYLTEHLAGVGVGRALFAQAIDDLCQRSFTRVFLWVLESNTRARRFYEEAGWHADGDTKLKTRGDVELREVRYATRLTARP